MNWMSSVRHLRSAVPLLILGCFAGIFTANSVSRSMRISAGTARLNAYASHLVEREQSIDRQTDLIIQMVQNDGLGFCSAEELRAMRALVYRSKQVKDIGRTRDGILYCSSEIGSLKTPPQVPLVKEADGKRFAWVPMMLIDGSGGIIARTRSISMVINPDVFTITGDPRTHYTVYLYDDRLRRYVKGFGEDVAITDRELLGEKAIERGGRILISRCLQSSTLCLVAENSKEAMLENSRRMQIMLIASGGAIGFALALTLVLLRLRYTSLQSQLRRAVRREELQLVYQPIVDLDTSVIVGAEALVRWKNQRGESITPDVFIPVAENCGIIREITQFVIRRSLHELGDLLRGGTFALSINISADDLRDSNFCSKLQTALKAARVESSKIGVELTERSTVITADTKRTLSELQAFGHRVYIDDFGTGYSSLAYLSELRADTIKIDRAFTALVQTGSITESIVPQILEMAEHLNLSVVVEGVETLGQAEYFRTRCSKLLAQGWLFGRPVDAQSLLAKIHQHCNGETAPQCARMDTVNADQVTQDLQLEMYR